MLILFAFCMSGVVYAGNNTNVNIDLTKLDSTTRDQVIKQLKNENDITKDLTAENVKKFSDYGVVIATTLKEVCKNLNVEVNEFIKTPAGMITTGLIVYKLVGKDIIHTALTLILYGCLFIVVMISFIYFHTSKKLVDKDKNIKYIPRVDWAKETRVWSYVSHWGVLIIFTLINFLNPQ